jgi:hypothetical protein
MADDVETFKKPKKMKKSEIIYAASPVAHDILVSSEKFELNDGEFTMKKAESIGGHKKPGIAFMEDPIVKDTYQGSLRLKKKLLPDNVIKDISNQNHLVAAILRSTGNVISQFGHLRKDRFDIGIDVEIKAAFKDKISIEDMPVVQERIQTFTKFLLNCGHTDDLKVSEKSPLADFMFLQGFNAYRFGRFATQMIYGDNAISSPSTLQRFRAVDVGTMYRVQQKDRIDGKDTKADQDAVRMSSIERLKELTGVSINPENFKQPEYSWGQMINGKVEQYFSDKEMLIYNAFPSTDVEHDGYPVSPLDTVITSVTTHISIETYNRLYFQNGRAAKGMLVVHSDEIDQSIIDHVKQQFNASINDVSNSFRTPIFGVNQLDKVEWVPTQSTSRDGEFQFLYDQVARNIFSAFGVSPDEIAGYNHLSKGTNQQSLTESSSEYKLTASRDRGIRPFIMRMQSWFNDYLFPMIDPELAQLCVIRLEGFDAQTREQENTRLTTSAPLHMTYNELLDEVDKKGVGKSLGGDFPFNEYYNLISDKYSNVGFLIAEMFGLNGAHFDPTLKYRRDAFYIQNLQLLGQYNPAAVKALFASRDNTIELLKELIQEELEEEQEEDGV